MESVGKHATFSHQTFEGTEDVKKLQIAYERHLSKKTDVNALVFIITRLETSTFTLNIPYSTDYSISNSREIIYCISKIYIPLIR